MNNEHPGFEKEAQRIAKKNNVSMSHARAILAVASREASGAAKRVNPKLKRVK